MAGIAELIYWVQGIFWVLLVGFIADRCCCSCGGSERSIRRIVAHVAPSSGHLGGD